MIYYRHQKPLLASLESSIARLLALLIASACLVGLAEAQTLVPSVDPQVSRRVITPDKTDRIVVRRGQTITVKMPGIIERLDGGGFTVNPENEGNFLLSPYAGREFFSVEPLKDGASNNINVIVGGQVYSIVFEESHKAQGLLNVVYSFPPPIKREDLQKPPQPKPVSTARLLSLFDKVKAYKVLKDQRPELVESLRTTTPYSVTSHNLYDVTLRSVFRDDSLDTLVFEIELKTKSQAALGYDPESFQVRVGDAVFFQSCADATGRIEPKARNVAWFAITGDGFGGRNNLDVFNNFEISMIPTGSATAEPILDTTPLDYSEPPNLPVPATPTPTPEPVPTPKPSWLDKVFPAALRPKEKPTPKPSPTPKVTPKTASIPKPKPTPKATPKPTPTPEATPKATPAPEEEASPVVKKAAGATPAPTPQQNENKPKKGSARKERSQASPPVVAMYPTVSIPSPSPISLPPTAQRKHAEKSPTKTEEAPPDRPIGTISEDGQAIMLDVPSAASEPSPTPKQPANTKPLDDQITVHIE
jgi:hypothetical protein